MPSSETRPPRDAAGPTLVAVLLALYTAAAPSLAVAQTPSTTPDAAPQRDLAERAVPVHVDRARYRGRLQGVTLSRLIEQGERLFRAKFTIHDGAGRPRATQAVIPTKRKRPAPLLFQRLGGIDASSCASCHNDPLVGGAGDFTVNAFVSEGFTNPDFDTIDPQFSNERNTNHLFGAGLIELLAREMTADLQAIRTAALQQARRSGRASQRRLQAKGIGFGTITAHPDGMLDLDRIEGVDPDLVIRPFSQKGVVASLRQFTVNALNHHHGMQARERFGPRWTGEDDFDADGKAVEITAGDVSALVAWQATRPAPDPARPATPALVAPVQAGSRQFDAIGCARCHVRALPLRSTMFSDPGPQSMAGTLRAGDVARPTRYDLAELTWVRRLPRNDKGELLVPLFGDLKRHTMTDRQVDALGNELLSQGFVGRNVFQTTELWGIGSTAPYGHRGNFTTLHAVIMAHGGEARASRDTYAGLSTTDRRNLIAFLKSMVIAP